MDMQADAWKRHRTLAGHVGLTLATVEANQYTSPEVFAAECEKIFRRAWLMVARDSEVPNPGDFIKRTIYPLGLDALIVRGKDGVVRGFHNVCAHRGSELVRESEGRTNLFVCPYHAWSYGTDGKCRAIPGAEFFPQVDRETIGLSPIHADIWNGFVFLNFDVTPKQTLGTFLGEVGERYAELPFGEFSHAMEMTLDVDANWKSVLDAFNESYHVPILHKKTLPDFPHPDNPHSVYYDTAFWPPHASHMIQGNPDWRPESDVIKFVIAKAGITSLRIADNPNGEPTRGLSDYECVNPIGMPHFWLRMLSILPFTQIAIFNDNYATNHFWPLAPDKTRYVQRYYFRGPPSSHLEEFSRAHMMATARELFVEDAMITRSLHRALSSGGMKHLHLGENELLLRHFHETVQAWLGERAPGVPESPYGRG
jgi:phenylpropionate dioxygenase-like ring-hydroxylating dioxygenase large terminal subunit